MNRHFTHRQERFVEEFLIDGNATQAAKRAGYSQRTARQMGAENLSKPAISKKIEQLIEERSNAQRFDHSEYVQALKEVVWADISDAFGPDGAPLAIEDMPEVFRNFLVVSVKKRETVVNGVVTRRTFSIQFVDRLPYLKALGEQTGAWVTKREARCKP